MIDLTIMKFESEIDACINAEFIESGFNSFWVWCDLELTKGPPENKCQAFKTSREVNIDLGVRRCWVRINPDIMKWLLEDEE